MLFNSIDFLIFLPIVVLIYFILPKKVKNLWLLISSYYFYMCWNALYALLIFTSTLATYLSGLSIEKKKHSSFAPEKKTLLKKLTVACCLVINLSILFYFKYYNFAAETITKIFGKLSISVRIPAIDVLLPVGISFYTFQALSYTIDVYRDDIYAEKNFFRYALFVSFFPQLVAGPIERSKNLLKQLAEPHKFCFDHFREGILLMLWGFFLKIVLADRIAIFVDAVYSNYSDMGGYYLIIATILFAVQIYCDFSGYSIIAMGTAKILGIDLMDNFNAPYFSTSVAEFWRKWHISLTSWFKDYLYIPLGGSRKGKIRKYLNKIIVFLVSGLWHGADLTYIVWGGINGFYQVFAEITQPFRIKLMNRFHLNRESLGHKIFQGLCTFILIDLTWVFFRANSFHEACEILKSMLSANNPWVLLDGSLYKCGLDISNFNLMLLGIGVLVFADRYKQKNMKIREVIIQQDAWFRWIFIALAIAAILTFGIWGPNYNDANFIYFQF